MWKIRHSDPGCNFARILLVLYFPVNTGFYQFLSVKCSARFKIRAYGSLRSWLKTDMYVVPGVLSIMPDRPVQPSGTTRGKMGRHLRSNRAYYSPEFPIEVKSTDEKQAINQFVKMECQISVRPTGTFGVMESTPSFRITVYDIEAIYINIITKLRKKTLIHLISFVKIIF